MEVVEGKKLKKIKLSGLETCHSVLSHLG